MGYQCVDDGYRIVSWTGSHVEGRLSIQISIQRKRMVYIREQVLFLGTL